MGVILKRVTHELEHHIPFTIVGALSGIVMTIVILYGSWLPEVSSVSETVFYILHPTHVFLSALVTTTLYVRYGKKNIWLVLLIGYTGSIGIATISDSIIPYLGELMLDLPNSGPHIGFIEEPIITNIPAFIGIAIGYFKGYTKIPHAGHVLISTWASLFHIIMAIGTTVSTIQLIGIFIFLFLAVWLPCCTSDIIYPLLFQKKSSGSCTTEVNYNKRD
ncbi:MAG: hypothetical protein JW771_04400 [Candidatus Thermoplasmatota archaeon]|nr:hypothetical protein [Candidatus Thermoplasmatota archaeon]